jgi:hypothetical protein
VIAVGILFRWHARDAVGQTAGWTVVFFFVSAAASAPYPTIGESFPRAFHFGRPRQLIEMASPVDQSSPCSSARTLEARGQHDTPLALWFL